MVWLLLGSVLWAAGAIFIRRFQRHLDQRSGPWIRE